MTSNGSVSGSLIVEFLNTLDLETGEDTIATPERLVRWATETRLLTSPAALPGAPYAHAHLLQTREALRELLALRQEPPHPTTVAASLSALLATTSLRATATDGHIALVAADADPASTIVAVVISDALAATAAGTWERVRVCHNPTCRWAFLDSSRNAKRVWCDMASCGAKIKMRNYRARRRASTSADQSSQ